jgi:hypothetical protein
MLRGAPILALVGIAILVWHPSFRQPSAPAPALSEQHPPAVEPAPVTESAIAPDAPAAADWDDDRDITTAAISTAASFAYSRNHPSTRLPPLAFAAMAGPATPDADGAIVADGPLAPAINMDAEQLRALSRDGLCSAIGAVARANGLPVPFFANLIWQESNFQLASVSPAGALGIAQFMPETANDHGLINPFEPIHALFSAGKLLRHLKDQYGNLGLAAAAYNAGPQRVNAWLAERRRLPGETRAYVVRITGQAADRWMTGELEHDPQASVQPARAPCAEVAEEVKAQARLAMDMAAATPPTVEQPAADVVPLPPVRPRMLLAAGMKDQSRPPAGRGSWRREPVSAFAAR